MKGPLEEVVHYEVLKVDDITRQVLRNCSISDSRHAGSYSICGLALRLRDLYKWEKGLEPWVEGDSSEVLAWIGDKEEEWEGLAGNDFNQITIFDRSYDPFDVKAINSLLEPHGLFYGAGYVHSLRPTFFLAILEDRKEIEGHRVYLFGRELARDLMTIPALVQDNCVLVRKESGKLFFWNQIFFVKKSGRHALKFALQECGVREQEPGVLRSNLGRIFASEMERYVYHELGELTDTVFDRDMWREIIGTFPHTPIELLARALKDLLADTNEHGTLRYITRERRRASLGFYVAFLDGLLKELLPELREAFPEFVETGDWRVIDQAISKGYDTSRYYAETMSAIYRKGKGRNDMKWVEGEMERLLLSPLGLVEEKRPSSNESLTAERV